jgi:hypothetical protein
LFSGIPRSAKEQVATKVMKAFNEPIPGGDMNNVSITNSQREEAKGSAVYSERFEGTVPSQVPDEIPRNPPTVDEIV